MALRAAVSPLVAFEGGLSDWAAVSAAVPVVLTRMQSGAGLRVFVFTEAVRESQTGSFLSEDSRCMGH